MKISREWATSLTIGAFGLMAVTGVLMFFHFDSRLNKLAHEWLGWAFLAGAGLHAAVNWGAFKRYFLVSVTGRAVIGVFAAILLASFLPLGGSKGAPPPVLAMNAVAKAPIFALAPLTGRPVETVLRQLREAGLAVAGPEASIDSVAGADRGLQAKAMTALFGGAGQ
jgi:hypothetical protein